MPYETPKEIAPRSYEVAITSRDRVGEYPVIIGCTATTDNIDSAQVEPIMQKFVDLINSSADFTVSGTRGTRYLETISPTSNSQES